MSRSVTRDPDADRPEPIDETPLGDPSTAESTLGDPSTAESTLGDPATAESLPSAETLELVSDETRRAILTALWTAEDAPLSFTTLRRRSGVEGSSRFNYHLQRLRRRCVRETDDGYVLTARGERLVATLSAVPSLEDAAATPPASD